VTGEIGAGADDVRFIGGSEANLASIFPISFACASGVNREIPVSYTHLTLPTKLL
jgi:hypothetical protein